MYSSLWKEKTMTYLHVLRQYYTYVILCVYFTHIIMSCSVTNYFDHEEPLDLNFFTVHRHTIV